MNKKAKILILSLAIVGSISIGAAAFVQFNDKVYASETNSGSQTGETYVVRFVGADNKEVKTIECQSGDTLDILDAPHYSSDEVWKATTNDQDGNPVFLNTHPEINQAYIFKEVSENDESLQGKVMAVSQDIGDIEESYDASNINEVDLYTWDEFIYHNTWKTFVVGKNSNILDGHYDYGGSASNLINEKKADTHIGLQSVKNEQITKHNYSYSNNSWSQTTQDETNTVTATPYINEVIDTSSSSSISNYCPIRIQLQNDVVLTGSLTLGARLGISDNATDWGQSKLQNIINGAYAELDLNGYNLIIAEGGSIDAYGSITDSKGTGNLIIEDGATMWATMVVEDAAREDSYPTQYLYGGQATNFFKCPYLNCNIIFKQGCNFYAKLGIRLGGSTNVGTWQDLLIIGNSSDAFIQFTSDSLNGQIQRETTFNEDIYEGGSTFAKYNLMDMQIEYSLLAGKVNVNDFTISYEYSVGGLGGFSGALPSNRSPLFIPPYYRFHLYKDTVATLYNLYIFMPSSYLIIDEDAEVKLSATGKSKTKFEAEGLAGLLLDLDVPEFEYQGVGGLYFLSHYQPFSEGYKYVDTSKRSEGDGYGATIYSNDKDSTNNAFNFYNGYQAYCELKGKIITDDNQTYLKRNYILAGHFDVANAAIDSFKTTLNNVQTYVSTYQIGPSRFADGKSGISKFVKINIMGYYSSPLIVKVNTGNQEADKYKVITPLLSGETAAKNLENTNLNRTYERLDQLIKQDDNGQNTYYAFIMNDVADATEQNVSFYNDRKAEFETTLAGSFREVTYDSEEDTINFNNEKYLLYQGAYLKCAGEVSHTSITKLWGYGAGKTAKSSTEFNPAPNCYLDISRINLELNDEVLNQPITDAKKENGQVVYTRVPNKSWKLTGDLPKPYKY